MTLQQTFPQLSQSELILHFSEEYPELSIRDEEFVAPKVDFWQPWYMKVLAYMTNNSLSVVDVNFLQTIESTEHFHVHREGLKLMLLTKIMQRLMVSAGIDDFNQKDITNPSRKRLLILLSGILNYLRYQEGVIGELDEIKKGIKDRSRHFGDLKVEKDQLLQKINSIRATQAEQQDKLAKLQAERDAKFSRIVELDRESRLMQVTITDVNARTEEIKTTVTARAERIAFDKKELDRLDSLIVHSPERTARDQKSMAEKLVQMKASREDLLRRLAEMKAARQIKRSVECQQGGKLLDGLCEAEAREREIVMEIKSKENELQQRKTELADREAEQQSLQRTQITRQEKYDKLLLQQRLKEDALRCELQEMQNVVDKLGIDHDRVRQVEEELRRVKQKGCAQLEEHAKRMTLLTEDRSTLLQAFNDYNKRIGDEFKAIINNNQLPSTDDLMPSKSNK